jgi:hypothetical protein
LTIEISAMMRRKSTSRRVHTFSSGSIRSDDIAAIDIALSRPLSRAGASDIGVGLGMEDDACFGVLMAACLGPPRR